MRETVDVVAHRGDASSDQGVLLASRIDQPDDLAAMQYRHRKVAVLSVLLRGVGLDPQSHSEQSLEPWAVPDE